MKTYIALLLLLLNGCASVANSSSSNKFVIENKDYKIISVEVDGEDIPVPSGASFSIDGDKIFGNAGCNSYFASFLMDRNGISVQLTGSTRMYCGKRDDNVFENAYLGELSGGFSVSGDENSLILESKKMKVVLEKK